MSYDRKKKQKTAAQRELDAEGARMFGKHVSKEKGRILLGMTLLACAAPMILGKRGYLDGKQATCFPGFEDDLKGATVRRDVGVVQDGTVVTAAGMGVALEFGLSLVAMLQGDEVAATLRATIQAR